MYLRTKVAAALATICMGATGAILLAGPASATDVPKPDPHQSAAYQLWLHTETVSDSSAQALAPNVTGGHRLTVKRGTPLLWTETDFTWYWSGSKMTSSSATQTCGFVFPNAASKGGVKRTLATSAQHDWTTSMNVGIGTVTPWGDVDLYRSTQTDHVSLFPGGKYKLS
jgi:hypothetical protein